MDYSIFVSFLWWMVRVIPELQTYLLEFLNKKERQSSKDVCSESTGMQQVRTIPGGHLEKQQAGIAGCWQKQQ